MSTSAQPKASGTAYRVLRELGRRAQPTYAAIREPKELVVVQRFARSAGTGAPTGEGVTEVSVEALAFLLRDARCLLKNWHPNLARARHVDLVGAELTIASELIDGATLADLFDAGAAARVRPADPVLRLPVLARILVDVLGGLHALHGLRDAMNAPVGAIHGELCPHDVVVGKDGVARVVALFRPRPVMVGAASEGLDYAAPEARDSGGTSDPRSDLYAVGVMLWEGLAGRPLYDDDDALRLRLRQREEDVPRPDMPEASPFAPLADVAMRALSFDPALRFRTAAEMASEIRSIAGPRLASGSTVAATVHALAGEDIRVRRMTLDSSSSGPRRRKDRVAPPTSPEDASTADGLTPSATMEVPPVEVNAAPPAPLDEVGVAPVIPEGPARPVRRPRVAPVAAALTIAVLLALAALVAARRSHEGNAAARSAAASTQDARARTPETSTPPTNAGARAPAAASPRAGSPPAGPTTEPAGNAAPTAQATTTAAPTAAPATRPTKKKPYEPTGI